MKNTDIFEFRFAHIVYDNNVYKDFVTFCGEDNLKKSYNSLQLNVNQFAVHVNRNLKKN